LIENSEHYNKLRSWSLRSINGFGSVMIFNDVRVFLELIKLKLLPEEIKASIHSPAFPFLLLTPSPNDFYFCTNNPYPLQPYATLNQGCQLDKQSKSL
jgi:hypothetical protein